MPSVIEPCVPAAYALSIPSPSNTAPPTPAPAIGTLNEGSLHAALKQHYAKPGDEFEVPLEGFVIDILRRAGKPDELLVEIQTGSFGAMGNKMDNLLGEHKMLLVHPIAVQTSLQKPGAKPRKSPRRGSIYTLLDELVSIPTLLDHPNLSLDVVLVAVTKVQVADAKARRGRGGFRTVDRILDQVIETHHFEGVDDLLSLLPDGLPPTFTTADLAADGTMSRDQAQKLAYCFKAACLFDQIDRTRAGYVYRLSS